ncbi:MAG: hypothetical protein QM736_01515 [Vicinamibacterales bacterium]
MPSRELLPKIIKRAQADHLQRQRLLEGMGEGSRQARPPEPEEHRRRAAADRLEGVRSRCSRSTRSSTSAKLHSRYEIIVETYNKTINIEAQLMVLMANRYILPAALEFAKQVGQSGGGREGGRRQDCRGQEAPRQSHQADRRIQEEDGQARRRSSITRASSAEKHAKHFRDAVIPAMLSLRETSDALEATIPHEVWPLPTYREMLFVK